MTTITTPAPITPAELATILATPALVVAHDGRGHHPRRTARLVDERWIAARCDDVSAEHGGAVANKYGYPAATDAVVACRVGSRW